MTRKGRRILAKFAAGVVLIVLVAMFGVHLTQEQEMEIERQVESVLDVYLEGDSVINVIPRGEVGDGDGGDTGDGDV